MSAEGLEASYRLGQRLQAQIEQFLSTLQGSRYASQAADLSDLFHDLVADLEEDLRDFHPDEVAGD